MRMMKRYHQIVFGAATLLTISLRTIAQTPANAAADPSAGPAKDLASYHRLHLEEKLYVHTDKDFYLSGEICWFKIYVVDATSHRPLDLSKVAYLEFLDKDNKPILQVKAGLAHGHGDGSVYLPLTLRSGNYKLRAYTNWMKNYGADWFFEKIITIVNTRRSAELHGPDTTRPTYPVAFFPEGGNLVENIPTKIGFRITDQYGRGIPCTGVVTEDDEDTVARFEPHKFGIGSFLLTPRSGHHYRAIFRLADGTAIPTLLPAAAKEGVVMNVTAEDQDHWRVDIRTSPANNTQVYLLAHTRQQVKFARTATLADGKASFVIDKNTLGEGISTFTLFDDARQPLCERLVFRRPAHPLHITIQPDKESYGKREKISLSIDAPENPATETSATAGESAANCSLSVFRVDALQNAPKTHIGDYLWLASDLRGKIDSPDYYFDHPEDEQAMDDLMLTHGWRRFRWGDTRSHAAPLFDYPPEYVGAIINGKLTDTRTNWRTVTLVSSALKGSIATLPGFSSNGAGGGMAGAGTGAGGSVSGGSAASRAAAGLTGTGACPAGSGSGTKPQAPTQLSAARAADIPASNRPTTSACLRMRMTCPFRNARPPGSRCGRTWCLW